MGKKLRNFAGTSLYAKYPPKKALSLLSLLFVAVKACGLTGDGGGGDRPERHSMRDDVSVVSDATTAFA